MIIKRQIGEKGQVVIPKDIRTLLGLRAKSSVVFEVENSQVKIKSEKEPEKLVKEFFTVARTKGKGITLEDIKKIEDGSYDLP